MDGETSIETIVVVEPQQYVSNFVRSAVFMRQYTNAGFKPPNVETLPGIGQLSAAVQPRLLLLVQAPGDTLGIANAIKRLGAEYDGLTHVVVVPALDGTEVKDIGWLPSYSGIDELFWVVEGAKAIVSPFELNSQGVWRRLLEDVPRFSTGTALIIGRSPVDILQAFHSEIADHWLDFDEGRLCWRTAFALSYAAPLPTKVFEWTKIAHYLKEEIDWFAHNSEDVRKVLRQIGDAWGFPAKPDGSLRYRIANFARIRGFTTGLPEPWSDIDTLFPFAMDLDVSGRIRASGVSEQWDELLLSTIPGPN